MRRAHLVIVGSITTLALSGCGSDNEAACVSSDVGEVCASTSGGVTFNGSGLEPGSEVHMTGPKDQTFVLQVGADGSFKPAPGTVGFVSTADAEFTFAVSAIDGDGDAVEGDITVTR